MLPYKCHRTHTPEETTTATSAKPLDTLIHSDTDMLEGILPRNTHTHTHTHTHRHTAEWCRCCLSHTRPCAHSATQTEPEFHKLRTNPSKHTHQSTCGQAHTHTVMQ